MVLLWVYVRIREDNGEVIDEEPRKGRLVNGSQYEGGAGQRCTCFMAAYVGSCSQDCVADVRVMSSV